MFLFFKNNKYFILARDYSPPVKLLPIYKLHDELKNESEKKRQQNKEMEESTNLGSIGCILLIIILTILFCIIISIYRNSTIH
jgi:predicted metal-binding transcription factor (methanogenesis marker protein 9)